MHFLGGLRSTRGLPLLGSAASHPLARRRHLPQNAQWLVRTLQPTATVHTPQVGFPQLRERLSMSSFFWSNLEREKNPMKVRERAMPSTRYEGVYHAAYGCQAASLSLTAVRLRGLKGTYRVESKKTAGFFARLERKKPDQHLLGCSACMPLLCGLKGDRLIAAVMEPHGKDDPDPHIGKRSERYRMTFAFSALALVILHGPRLALRGLPGKLVQRIAQRFDAAQPSMRLGVHPALKQHGRGPGQGLQTGRIDIAGAVVDHFRQQSWRQSLSRSRKTAEDLMVGMGQEKVGDPLIVGRNLLEKRHELTDQCQHQARLGAGGDGICSQMRKFQGGEDRRSRLAGIGMTSLLEDRGDLLLGSSRRRLWSRIRLRKDPGRVLLQFGKELQRHGVVGFEASRQLIDQPSLHLDQALLITGKRFEFGHLCTVGREAVPIREISSSCFGQQIGINRIRFGPPVGSPPIHGTRIDRIHWPASLQQGSNQQTMGGLDDAGHLLFRDRKSTRLNSSHSQISYAVFCLKKKKNTHKYLLSISKNTTLRIGLVSYC